MLPAERRFLLVSWRFAVHVQSRRPSNSARRFRGLGDDRPGDPAARSSRTKTLTGSPSRLSNATPPRETPTVPISFSTLGCLVCGMATPRPIPVEPRSSAFQDRTNDIFDVGTAKLAGELEPFDHLSDDTFFRDGVQLRNDRVAHHKVRHAHAFSSVTPRRHRRPRVCQPRHRCAVPGGDLESCPCSVAAGFELMQRCLDGR